MELIRNTSEKNAWEAIAEKFLATGMHDQQAWSKRSKSESLNMYTGLGGFIMVFLLPLFRLGTSDQVGKWASWATASFIIMRQRLKIFYIRMPISNLQFDTLYLVPKGLYEILASLSSIKFWFCACNSMQRDAAATPRQSTWLSYQPSPDLGGR